MADSLEATVAVIVTPLMTGSIASYSTDESGGDADALVNSTEDRPEVQLALLSSGAVVGPTSTTYMTTDDGPDGFIVFFKNQMPYTAVEKRAERVYGALHRDDNLLKKPVLIADSQDALETICQAFGNSRGDGVMEKLDIYEKLLEELSN